MSKNILKSISIIFIILFIVSLVICRNVIITKYYFYDGYFKHQSGNNVGAIASYSKVLELNKRDVSAYINRASAYFDNKNFLQAISDYSIALKYYPNNAELYCYRGRSYYEVKDIKHSLIDYDKAINLNSTYGLAYLNRGLLKYTLMFNQQEGCNDFKLALKYGEKGSYILYSEAGCE